MACESKRETLVRRSSLSDSRRCSGSRLAWRGRLSATISMSAFFFAGQSARQHIVDWYSNLYIHPDADPIAFLHRLHTFLRLYIIGIAGSTVNRAGLLATLTEVPRLLRPDLWVGFIVSKPERSSLSSD